MNNYSIREEINIFLDNSNEFASFFTKEYNNIVLTLSSEFYDEEILYMIDVLQGNNRYRKWTIRVEDVIHAANEWLEGKIIDIDDFEKVSLNHKCKN